MKPKNLTVSNICKAIAKENKMKVEDISSQVSYLLISVHNTNEHNKLNAIYESYKYSKPTKNGFSTIRNSGKPYTMDDRINYINGFIDMNDAIIPEYTNDERAKQMMLVLSMAIKDELVEKYGKEYKIPANRYIVGLKEGYKSYKKTSR